MRDLITDEAVSLFAARGYGGSSMRELARRCGTTASNVYNYFPSKRDLLEEIFRRGTDQIRETIEAGRGDGPSGLEAYLLSVVSTVRANRDLWRLIHQLRHDESVREVMDETFGTYLREITAELGAYTGAPWLLLSLVDGVAASIIQELPLPDDDVLVPTLARAVRAVEPSPPLS